MRNNASTKEHRLDIQGLRGISILLVFLFHIDPILMPAGFFGVDIFFVISGFVITNHLIRQHAAEGISLAKFLAARAKRLLPNATLVLLSVLMVGAILLPAFRFDTMAKDVFWASIYLSNFHFAAVAVDYFTSNEAPSPVVHFWSLSVEEQFYVVWPTILLLLAAAHVRKRFRWAAATVAGVICVASFAACILLLRHNQPLAFFGTGTRVWEIGAGAILALGMTSEKRMLNAHFRGAIALAAFISIVLSAIAFNESFQHPGLPTLIPVLATVALIYSGGPQGSKTLVSRLLAFKPLTSLGDRSYSLYLWHWPVLALGKLALGSSPFTVACFVILVFVLAELAFRYVELPIRRGHYFPAAPIAQLAAGGTLILTVLTATIVASQVSTHFVSPIEKRWLQLLSEAERDRGDAYGDNCHSGGEDVEISDCVYGPSDATKTAIIFGDSHAAHWLPALQKAAFDLNWRIRPWSKSVCPAANIRVWDARKKVPYRTCDEWRSKVFARLVASDEKFLVILSSSNNYGGYTRGADDLPMNDHTAVAEEYFQKLIETVNILSGAGHEVAIIRDTPLAEPSYKECIINRGGGDGCERIRHNALLADPPELRVAKLNPGVHLIDVSDIFCGPVSCPVVKNNLIIYRDNSHMTATFARTLSSVVAEIFAKSKLNTK